MKPKPVLTRGLILVVMALTALISHPTPTQAQTDCTTVTEIPQAECEALVALYTSTDGPNWTTNTGWLQTNTPCSWYGVTCGGGQVTELKLGYIESVGSNNLNGAIPSEIGNLTSLTTLDLSNNQLSSLPTEIGNLTSLTSLYLHNNQLSSLPTEIGNLTSLTTLDLRSNQLSSLPTEIGNLTSLTRLYLDNNQLSSLPTEIGNLTSLTRLYLDNNQLSSLPTEIGNLTSLTSLDLRSNQLSSLPTEIGNLTSLTSLDLRSNQLSSLPPEISNLTNLTIFDVSYNALQRGSTVDSFLDTNDPGWDETQTIPVSNLQDTAQTETSLTLDWTPITYTTGGGYYELHYDTVSGPPYSQQISTTDKTVATQEITGLTPGTTYYMAARTYSANPEVWSDYSAEIVATTAAASQPDLRAINLTLTPASPVCQGDSVTIEATAYNQGPADAPPHAFSFYQDSQQTGYSNELIQKTVNGMASSETRAVAHTFTATTTGSFYIKALADSTAVITESDETNNGTSVALTINADTQPPLGTILINNGDASTHVPTVTLTLSADDSGGSCHSGVTQMRFMNEGEAWSNWEAYSTSKSWTLPSSQGTQTVYVEYQDAEGNTSTSYFDTINNVNNLPVANNVAITPAAPTETEPLQVSYTYSDADSDPEGETQIEWYRDGNLQAAYTNQVTLPATATTPGEIWTAVVQPHDGLEYGNPVTSAGVTISANPIPYAHFTVSRNSGPSGFSVNFDSSASQNYLTCEWDFGDGTTSGVCNPTNHWFDYTAPTPIVVNPVPLTYTTYTVVLTVTGDHGSAVTSTTITAYQSCVASFTTIPAPPIGTTPFTVQFINNSSGACTTAHWDFGTGDTSTAWEPTYTFHSAGTYHVTLTPEGPGAPLPPFLPSTDDTYVTVQTSLDADFTATPILGAAPLTVQFTSNIGGDYSSVNWDFDDGGNSTQLTPTYEYALPGIYTVTLTINRPGQQQVIRRPQLITVTAPVRAMFETSPTNVKVGQTVTFSDTSSGDVIARQWQLANGLVFTAPNFSHSFSQTSHVTLTVTGWGGDTDTVVKTVSVYKPCVPSFNMTLTPPTGQAPVIVNLTNTSTGDCQLVNWNFGDGTGPSQAPNPAHEYTTSGDYTITLTMRDAEGEHLVSNSIEVKGLICDVTVAPVINPAQPRKYDDLTLTYDRRCNLMRQRIPDDKIVWYQNDVPVSLFYNQDRVTATHTYPLDKWHVEVTPCDGNNCGNPVKSAPVYVRSIPNPNFPPEALQVTIVPSTPLNTDSLTVTYVYTDPDNDPEQATQIFWVRNNEQPAEFANRSVIQATETKKDEFWCVRVRPHDGQEYGDIANSAECVKIGSDDNRAPQALEPTLHLVRQQSQTELNLDFRYYDADGDVEVISHRKIQWFRITALNPKGQLQPEFNDQPTLRRDVTLAGELWFAKVQVHDGKDDSQWAKTLPVQIKESAKNTPPRLENVKILPAEPGNHQNLTLHYDFIDVDGDPPGDMKVTWFKNLTHEATYDDLNTIPHTDTEVGQTWFAWVTPVDMRGAVGVSVDAASVTIQATPANTPPTAENVYISPNKPVSTSTLEVNYEFDDRDGDAEGTTKVRWEVNGAVTPYTGTIVDGSIFKPIGTTWCAIVTPVDIRRQEGTEVTSAPCATIQNTFTNTPPSIYNAEIYPKRAPSSANLELTYNIIDPDCNHPPCEFDTQITWFKEGHPQTGLRQQLVYTGRSVVPSTHTSPGESWSAKVRPHDGQDYGGEYLVEAVRINHVPIITAVHVNSRSPAQQPITVTCDYFDKDDDPPFGIDVFWARDNDRQTQFDTHLELGLGEIKLPADVTEQGEEWTVTCRPHDGVEEGTSLSSTIKIGAVQPEPFKPVPVYLPAIIKHPPSTPTPSATTTPIPPTSTPTSTNTPTPTPTITPTPSPTPRCRAENRYEDNDLPTDACRITPDELITGTFPEGPYADDENDSYYFILERTSTAIITLNDYQAQDGQLAVYHCPPDFLHYPEERINYKPHLTKNAQLQPNSTLILRDDRTGEQYVPGGRYCIRVYTYPNAFNNDTPYTLSIEIIPR